MIPISFLIFHAFLFVHVSGAAVPCVPRSFGNDGTVCVCNASYCDTVEPATPVASGKFIAYTSSKGGDRFKKTTGDFKSNTVPFIGMKFTVNVNQKYQTVLGFGTAFTDSAGINLLSLATAAQDKLLRSYFSPDGIELNFGRVPMAGTDFSTHPYTYDDVANDVSLSKFNLTMEDFDYKIPIIKRAQAMNQRTIKLLTAAWSSPPWTKTSKDYVRTGQLMDKYYQLWADYHVKFLDQYKARGLNFWGMSTGNEPIAGFFGVISSLSWLPSSHATWIAKNLGPTVRKSPHAAIKLLAVDDSRITLPTLALLFSNSSDARKYIDGIALHWYTDNVTPAIALDATHYAYPEKFLLATEACVGPFEFPKVSPGSWSRGEQYTANIIEDLSNWVTGWIDWNFALDMNGGPNWSENFVDSPILVNATKKEFYKQPMFYALGHFSKFVTEGSTRVQVDWQGLPLGLQVVAFLRPDKAVVAVVFNRLEIDVPFSFSDPKKGQIIMTIPKRSVHTILYW